MPTERGAKRRVLVIEDEAPLRRILTRTLARVLDVVAVASAEEALHLVDEGQSFDVIFCDLNLTGMSGKSFYDRLLPRSLDLASRVVIMSGASFDDGDAFTAALSARWLLKPASLEAIEGMVDRVASGLQEAAPTASEPRLAKAEACPLQPWELAS
jgi:CheY-like chemotaxis protein